MDVLVAYDVSTETRDGRRRLRRVAIVCKDFGQRVQYSVFECKVNEDQYESLKARLLDVMNGDEDSLRIYRLRSPGRRRSSATGATATFPTMIRSCSRPSQRAARTPSGADSPETSARP